MGAAEGEGKGGREGGRERAATATSTILQHRRLPVPRERCLVIPVAATHQGEGLASRRDCVGKLDAGHLSLVAVQNVTTEHKATLAIDRAVQGVSLATRTHSLEAHLFDNISATTKAHRRQLSHVVDRPTRQSHSHTTELELKRKRTITHDRR